MAVQDQESQQHDAAGGSGRRLPWREVLGHAPAVLVVGAVLMYGYLSICYERFYGFLGVDPNDVGLSYTGTLARSSGFVVVYVLLAYLGFAMGQDVLELRDMPGRPLVRTSMITGFALVGLLVVGGAIWPPLAAGVSADDVKAGRPVGPLLFPAPLPPIPILAIHADPATVEPAGKPGDAPAAERLRGRKLLYLGQSGGTVVLYDAAAQQAVYVAAGSIVLHVANCDATPPPDPSCAQIASY
jgi:hypothetical protein